MRNMNAATEWQAWVDRWDRQQERYLVDREGRFSLMLEYTAAHLGSRPRVLDLCCGNGALTRRVLASFPDARVTAVDWDPVHLEIARRTLPDEVSIIEADVARVGWSAAVPPELDLVVTATALHWLEQQELVRLYVELAERLAPGGLFMNADHLPPSEGTIRHLGDELTERWQEANFAEGEETHTGFHEAAAADPALREAAALRSQRFAEHGSGDSRSATVGFHRAALLEAGFREVAEVWRHRSDAVLVAVR
jgi:trans-aconitate methyltransferase